MIRSQSFYGQGKIKYIFVQHYARIFKYMKIIVAVCMTYLLPFLGYSQNTIVKSLGSRIIEEMVTLDSINVYGVSNFKLYSATKNSILLIDSITRIIDYKDVDFKYGISAWNAIFHDWIHFSGATFRENASFMYVTFKGRTSFSSAKFKEQAAFVQPVFTDWISFTNAKFEKDLLFLSAVCEDQTSFMGCNFYHKVDFYNSSFERRVNFSKSTFFKECNFHHSVFYDSVDYSEVEFKESPNFIGVQLPENLVLKQLKTDSLNGIIKFIDARIDSLQKRLSVKVKCRVFVHQTDLSKLLLPHDLFVIGFDSTDNYDEQLRVYEQLIKKCRDEGYLASAQGWDIDYQKLKNLHDWGSFGPILNFINDWWWDFGYSRGRILFFWLPFFLFVFFVINLLLIRWLVTWVYFDPELGKQFSGDTSQKTILRQLSRFRFRAAYTLFYTSVIYFNIRLSHEATNYKNFWGLVYLYFLYAVGTLHVVFGILGYLLKT